MVVTTVEPVESRESTDFNYALAAVITAVVGLALVFTFYFFPLIRNPSPVVGDVATFANLPIPNSPQIASISPADELLYINGDSVIDYQPQFPKNTFKYATDPISDTYITSFAYGTDDQLYYADANGNVWLYSSGRNILLLHQPTVELPVSLALGATGTLYIADQTRGLLEVPLNGPLRRIGSAYLLPIGVAVSPSGVVYVTDTAGTVYYVGPNNSLVQVLDIAPLVPNAPPLQLPYLHLAFSTQSDLIICDQAANEMWEVRGKRLLRLLGNGMQASSPTGTPASAASIYNTGGITVTSDDHLLYVENFDIRKVLLRQ